MPDTWEYTRPQQKSPKTRQRVRLTVALTPSGGDDIANIHFDAGHYARAWTEGDALLLGWTSHGVPAFQHQTTIVASDAAEPHLAVDPDANLVLLYRQVSTADAMIAYSYDHGLTITTPTVAIANGTHPVVAYSPNGEQMIMAYVAGKIQYTYRAPGDTSASTAANIKDDAGADILVTDNKFGLSHSLDPDGPWILAVRLDGSTDVIELESWSDGATWAVVP